MRALILALLWTLVGPGLAGPGLARAAPGFDHGAHATAATVPLACASCHLGPTGLARPSHAACFRACHGGGAGTRPFVAGDRATVCAVCHAEPTLARRAPTVFPLGHDLAASLGHTTHATVPCGQCHALTGAAPRAHARCGPCHDGAPGRGPAMAACETCHTAARAQAHLAPTLLPLAFSHARHAARGPAGKACATCHAALASGGAGTSLPRVTLATCASCHDGATAFATTATCARCHDAAPREAWSPAEPGARFSHAAHGATAQVCVTCHALAATGEPAVAHHAACAGCHALHPGAAPRTPRERDERPICGACHEGTEPWRHLVADRAPPDATELGASLDHGKHLGACVTCHARRTPTSQLQLPLGHAACAGAACHALVAGPLPQLVDCAGCHRLNLVPERIASRTSAPWTVRAAFDHARHGGRTQLPCAGCHTQLSGVELLEMPTPTKATCAPCHDGRAAFKLTGTTCRKCHVRAA